MKIISTNIGARKEVTFKSKTFFTGIYKFPVEGSIFLSSKAVKGDEISDKKYHGGILQAVYAYSLEHYAFWKEKYPNVNFNFGMFGENLTVKDLDERNIHTGDTFKVGETILEATIQRDPCYKLGARFNDMKIIKQFWNTTFCGVYFKVLQTGNVKVGDEFIQIKSCTENPTIADLYLTKKIKKGF